MEITYATRTDGFGLGIEIERNAFMLMIGFVMLIILWGETQAQHDQDVKLDELYERTGEKP